MTGFAMAFHIAFGFRDARYKDFPEAVKTLFEIMLGEFDMASLRAINPYLAPVFFSLYVVVMVMVVISMFVAIVNAAYEDTVQRLQLREFHFFANQLHYFSFDSKGRRMRRMGMAAALNLSPEFQAEASFQNLSESDAKKMESIIEHLKRAASKAEEEERQFNLAQKLEHAKAAGDAESGRRSISSSSRREQYQAPRVALPHCTLNAEVNHGLINELHMATGFHEEGILRDTAYLWGTIVAWVPGLHHIATERSLLVHWKLEKEGATPQRETIKLIAGGANPNDDEAEETKGGEQGLEETEAGGGQRGEEEVDGDEEAKAANDLYSMMAVASGFELPTLTPAEKLFMKRLEAPRLVVLKQLLELETQQRKMLDAIEFLGKRSRGVAHSFAELKSKREHAAKKAQDEEDYENAIVRTLLPKEGEF